MGVHIYLVRKGEKYTDRLPYINRPGYKAERVDEEFGWDWMRMAGDRELPKFLNGESFFVDETSIASRPADVEVFRRALLALGVNESRWNKISDILRDNPDVYVEPVW